MLESLGYWAPILGGAAIGVAASMLLVFESRIAGISGILGGLFTPKPADVGWRVAFGLGLVTAGALAAAFAPGLIRPGAGPGLPVLVLAGLLVGFGTRLGNGCTSGHGVCGLSRLSRRSAVSVLTFIGVGMAVATLVGRFAGGA